MTIALEPPEPADRALAGAEIAFRAPLAADDAPARLLFDRAFGPGRFAKTAERLREGNRLDRERSLLVESVKESRLIGAAQIWPIAIGSASAVLLGPFAIAPEWQAQGLGAALMQALLDGLDAAGRPAALLVGDRAYYGRFGFEPAGDAVRLPGPVDQNRVLIRAAPSCEAWAGPVRADPPAQR